MVGNFGNDTFRVDNAADKVDDDAGRGQDTVFASTSYKLQAGAEVEFLRTAGSPTGAFTLAGNEFANTIVGNDGSNVVNGGDGADTLTGDLGKDFFRFDTTLDPTTTNPATNTNKDRITDFVASADTIQLDDGIFKALSKGALAATAFRVGTQAIDTNDRIIYNDVTGALIYDFERQRRERRDAVRHAHDQTDDHGRGFHCRLGASATQVATLTRASRYCFVVVVGMTIASAA